MPHFYFLIDIVAQVIRFFAILGIISDKLRLNS